MNAEISSLEHATAIYNPVSTRNKSGRKLLKEFCKNASFPVNVISSSSDKEANIGIIKRSLEHEADGGALIIVSGDGFFNTVVNTITNNGLSDEAKHTPLWAFGGGNANDGLRASHDKKHRKEPNFILKDGRIIETHPIRFDIQRPQDKKPETRTAAFYASLGISALASSVQYLNNPNHRERLGRYAFTRSISEPLIVMQALLAAKDIHASTQGKEFSFIEMGFINSGIMAKYLRYPVSLTENQMLHVTIKDKISIASNLVKLIREKEFGQYIGLDQSVSLETSQDAYAQFDGEAQLIPSGSSIKVGLHDQTIRIVASNQNLWSDSIT